MITSEELLGNSYPFSKLPTAMAFIKDNEIK
jgi:hypothetical protein